MSCVEKYDPDEDRWTSVRSMSTALQYAGIGVINDKLYVVGGHNIRDGSPIKVVICIIVCLLCNGNIQ